MSTVETLMIPVVLIIFIAVLYVGTVLPIRRRRTQIREFARQTNRPEPQSFGEYNRLGKELDNSPDSAQSKLLVSLGFKDKDRNLPTRRGKIASVWFSFVCVAIILIVIDLWTRLPLNWLDTAIGVWFFICVGVTVRFAFIDPAIDKAKSGIKEFIKEIKSENADEDDKRQQ